MPFKWGRRSLRHYRELHPDLKVVVDLALSISLVDMAIIDGGRTDAEQRRNVDTGASKTMNSRHLMRVPKGKAASTGQFVTDPVSHAVDIAPFVDGEVSWHWPHYHAIASTIKQASEDAGIPLDWGGDWVLLKDGPHWQLPWSDYPVC